MITTRPWGRYRAATCAAGLVCVCAVAGSATASASWAAAPTGAAGPTATTADGPVVTSVSPMSGPSIGGTHVTITGTRLGGVRRVLFGSYPGTQVHVTGASTLTVVAPKHPAGRVDVRVVTGDGVSAQTPADAFTYRAGPLVVLDPGHNGGNATHPREIDRRVYAGYGRTKPCNTTGTQTNAGYPEHAFTWDVARRARAILLTHGVRVLLTRPSDSGVGPCVNRRAQIESGHGVALAVAIHADGAASSGHGFHVNQDSRRPEGATADTQRRSARLGRLVHDALVRGSGLVPSTYVGHAGYVFRSDLAGLNLTTKPTTFLELGNMRNAHDAALQASTRGRARIAAAVARGVLAYLHR